MSGNVWEWTNSLYEDYPYDPEDGREADTRDSTDVLRVLRGGSWADDPVFARAARRFSFTPDFGDTSFGFRVVVSAPPT